MPYDIIGSIAIVKFKRGAKKSEKLKLAKELLKNQKNVKTVLEKSERVKGRLRTIKTRFLAGVKTLETIHKENNCRFKLNVETCYFSPRLAEERKEVASKIKKNDKVLVLFSGVNPYGIVIAKKSRAKVVSIELGKECCNYARENAKLNKVLDKVTILQGNVKKIVKKGRLNINGNWVPLRFDVIVMPRPNLGESFLKQAFSVSKKRAIIYYYGFCHECKLSKLIEEIYKESKKARKKIKIMKVKKAGDIAPYKYRYRIEIKVLNYRKFC